MNQLDSIPHNNWDDFIDFNTVLNWNDHTHNQSMDRDSPAPASTYPSVNGEYRGCYMPSYNGGFGGGEYGKQVMVDHLSHTVKDSLHPYGFGSSNQTDPIGAPISNGNGKPCDQGEDSEGIFSSDGPVFPPPNEMLEEGFSLPEWRRTVTTLDAPISSATFQEECVETECLRKRARNESCSKQGSKACRERVRREKLNERFSELCSVLEPGRPVKTDKMAILGDAIRALNQLKTESEEYKEMNQKLLEEIKTLKAEKNELREEKLTLKADKERMEQELKAMAAPPASFIPPHPAAYQPAVNKMAVFPSYGYVPMWQYLPPSTRDTSQDHELRPPAA